MLAEGQRNHQFESKHETANTSRDAWRDDLRPALFAGLLLAMMLSNGFTAEVDGRGMTSAGSGLAIVVEEADVRFRGFFVSKNGVPKAVVAKGPGPDSAI